MQTDEIGECLRRKLLREDEKFSGRFGSSSGGPGKEMQTKDHEQEDKWMESTQKSKTVWRDSDS